MTRSILCVLLVLPACATLGPNPATTGVSAIPQATPGAELQLGVMPGYYLSQSTTQDPKGAGIAHLSLALDPGKWIPGLVGGFRIYGPKGDTLGEPMLGYRHQMGAVSVGGIGYYAQGSATNNGASYSAKRGGAEVAVDVRLGAENKWAEPHVIASASATHVSASGTYCQDSTMQFGVDCPKDGTPTNVTMANASGTYPAGTLGVALDVGSHLDSMFRGARVELLGGGGMMPHVVAGAQSTEHAYLTIGLALTVRGAQ